MALYMFQKVLRRVPHGVCDFACVLVFLQVTCIKKRGMSRTPLKTPAAGFPSRHRYADRSKKKKKKKKKSAKIPSLSVPETGTGMPATCCFGSGFPTPRVHPDALSP